eukprot:2841071-Prymnesium_polylepis.3
MRRQHKASQTLRHHVCTPSRSLPYLTCCCSQPKAPEAVEVGQNCRCLQRPHPPPSTLEAPCEQAHSKQQNDETGRPRAR